MADFRKLIERGGEKRTVPGNAIASRGESNRRQGLMVFAAMLVLSAIAVWLGAAVVDRLAKVEQEIERLSLRSGVDSKSLGDEALRTEMRELGSRVDDLGMLIEGPFSHLRQSNEESLKALSQRLERLERDVAARRAQTPTDAEPPIATDGNSQVEVTSGEGGWVINLIALSSKSDAQKQMMRLRKAGVRVEMQHAEHDGKSWYRLRVPGFSSYEGAKAYIKTVEKQANVDNAWVAKE